MTINLKLWVKDMITNVIENIQATEATFEKYLSKDFVLHVDGKVLNYDGFVAHMQSQKKSLRSVKIEYVHMVAEEDKVFTILLPHAIRIDGQKVEMKIIALWQVKNEKLILCDELTHLIKGESLYNDLNSPEEAI